jgi:hypothetical protein
MVHRTKEMDGKLLREFNSLTLETYESFREEQKVLQLDRRRLELEYEQQKVMMGKFRQIYADRRIYLDVGGRRFLSSVSILTRVPSSYFATILTANWAHEFDPTKPIQVQVERDGTYFHHVLEFLEHGTVCTKDPDVLRRLRDEFDFYCLDFPRHYDEVHLILGGTTSMDVWTRHVERFNPITQTWRNVKHMPALRRDFATCSMDGFVYVIGGQDRNQNCLSTCIRYDPVENRWIDNVPRMPVSLSDHVAHAVGNAIYVLGGKVYDGEFNTIVYKLQDNVWSEETICPPALTETSLADTRVCTVQGHLYLIVPHHLYRYDAQNKSWVTLSEDTNNTRFCDTLCVLDGMIYTAGFKTMSCYNTHYDTWSVLPPTRYERMDYGIFAHGGSIYAVGGADYDGRINITERYIPHLGTWVEVRDGELKEDRSDFHTVSITCASKMCRIQDYSMVIDIDG